MMKSAEDSSRGDLAAPLHGPTARRILGQRQVRPDFIVIVGVGGKDPAQVGLAKDDDMIKALPADRSNQPLRMPVLPR